MSGLVKKNTKTMIVDTYIFHQKIQNHICELLLGYQIDVYPKVTCMVIDDRSPSALFFSLLHFYITMLSTAPPLLFTFHCGPVI